MEEEPVFLFETQQQEEIFLLYTHKDWVSQYLNFFSMVWPENRMHSRAPGLETSLSVLQGYPDEQEKGYCRVSSKCDNQCFSSFSFTPGRTHSCPAAHPRLTPSFWVGQLWEGLTRGWVWTPSAGDGIKQRKSYSRSAGVLSASSDFDFFFSFEKTAPTSFCKDHRFALLCW